MHINHVAIGIISCGASLFHSRILTSKQANDLFSPNLARVHLASSPNKAKMGAPAYPQHQQQPFLADMDRAKDLVDMKAAESVWKRSTMLKKNADGIYQSS